MSARWPKPAYVYRLLISWPSPADEYQWGRRRRLHYMTRAGAQVIARDLRAKGAVVDIERSHPVLFPGEGIAFGPRGGEYVIPTTDDPEQARLLAEYLGVCARQATENGSEMSDG